VAVAVAVGLTLVTAGPAIAASGDWPTYGATNGRSGFNAAETAITPSTASHLHVAWTAAAQNTVFSQPVISNGLVYWGSFDGYERATNSSGGLVWQTYLGQTTACNATAGVASTATVVNGVVYVGGGDAQLYALDATTGAVLWQTRLGVSPSTFLWGSPAVFGGSVYMGVASYLRCPLVQGQLVRLDATTGAVENTMKVVPDGCLGGAVWSTPSVDEAAGTVYFATGNPGPCRTTERNAEAVIEVRASDLGVIGHWQIPPAQQTDDGDFGSSPTLFTRTLNRTTQAMVGIANKNGVYYALKRDHLGAGPMWQIPIAISGACPQCGQGSIAPSAWDGHTLYVAGGNTTINGVRCAGSVGALNPATGGILWQRCLPDGPVLGAVTSAPGVVAVAEGNQILIVSATSGQTLFAYTTQSSIWGAPSIANGVLYIGDNSGTLYAFSVPGLTTSVLVPSNGAFLAGSQTLDASASGSSGVTKVEFHLTGGMLNDTLIATATPSSYGWLASWDTTTVPDGTYTLQSVAYDGSGNSARSLGVSINIDNNHTPPTTSVLVPSNGATLLGSQTLDASASGNFGVTKVEFHLTGGMLNDTLIATATPSSYGWLANWDTTTVSDGTYTLQSVAYDGGGDTGVSPGISVTVNN
jgi:polyvinyl alcohol dehydrogenase (cytochrome)